MTPRFVYQETREVIDSYFLFNINPSIEYRLTSVFLNRDMNLEVTDDSANQVIVTIQAFLLMTYEYEEKVIISLGPSDGWFNKIITK